MYLCIYLLPSTYPIYHLPKNPTTPAPPHQGLHEPAQRHQPQSQRSANARPVGAGPTRHLSTRGGLRRGSGRRGARARDPGRDGELGDGLSGVKTPAGVHAQAASYSWHRSACSVRVWCECDDAAGAHRDVGLRRACANRCLMSMQRPCAGRPQTEGPRRGPFCSRVCECRSGSGCAGAGCRVTVAGLSFPRKCRGRPIRLCSA